MFLVPMEWIEVVDYFILAKELVGARVAFLANETTASCVSLSDKHGWGCVCDYWAGEGCAMVWGGERQVAGSWTTLDASETVLLRCGLSD